MAKQVITIKDNMGKSVFFDQEGAELTVSVKDNTPIATVFIGAKVVGSFPNYISAIAVDARPDDAVQGTKQ